MTKLQAVARENASLLVGEPESAARKRPSKGIKLEEAWQRFPVAMLHQSGAWYRRISILARELTANSMRQNHVARSSTVQRALCSDRLWQNEHRPPCPGARPSAFRLTL